MATVSHPEVDDDMFRPPLARGMKVIDRAFFQKTVALKAARVFDNKNISRIRAQLERSKDAFEQDRLPNVHSDPDAERAKAGKKCILLRPEVHQRELSMSSVPNGTGQPQDNQTNGTTFESSSYSSTLTELIRQDLISIIQFDLKLTYDYWTYHDIISSILPSSALSEIPSGFSQVGHVVHMNLREAYLPYKHLIANIIRDKNPGVTTVINKIDDVGEESEFRTFKYEVLAGEDNLNVVVSESGCEFRFDYAKVYWNPRLSTEHHRLVDTFKEGEAVCDVMAGIGPFAVPAGKKNVFVWANDLNPDSYACLEDAVKRNKVGRFVRPFCADGRNFIRDAARSLLEEDTVVQIKRKISRRELQANGKGKMDDVVKELVQPKVFQHYVLNLPASALTFLPHFVGLYPPSLKSRLPQGALMPVVHAYCFSTKDETIQLGTTDSQGAEDKICAEISGHLQFNMQPGKIDSSPGAVEIWDVRDVAPKKRMFCASFRLPEEVAFRAVD